MDEGARDALREIIASEGAAVLDDQRRFRGLLLDRCGGSRVEVKLLMAALEEDVPAMMLAGSDGTPAPMLVDRLSHRLQEARSLAPESARWSVDSWALALGITDRLTASRPGTPEAAAAGGTEMAGRTATADRPSVDRPSVDRPSVDQGDAEAQPPPAAAGRGGKKTVLILALAAIAALIAVIVVVVVVAVSGGGGGGGSSKSKAAGSPTTVAGAAKTPEEALRDLIPSKVKDQGNCAKPDVRATVRFNNVPVLACTVSTASGSDISLGLFYYALPDQTTIDGGFDSEVSKYRLGAGTCDPDVNPSFTANSGTFYTQAQVPVGRVLCGVDANGNPFMQWTDTRHQLYQSALVAAPAGTNPDKLALKKAMFGFWHDTVGAAA